MSELPKGWVKTELQSLFVFVIGGDWGKADDFTERGYEDVYCIRGSEFRNWNKEKGVTASHRKVKASSLEKRKLELGDILIEISGGGPDQPVGRTVLIDEASLANNPEFPKVCTNFLRLTRPSVDVDSRYLNYFLRHFYLSGEVVRYQGGSNNLRNLKFKEYSKIDVMLAPYNEQIRIANKLDTLLVKVDKAQARLDKIPTILKRFRQAVLAAATSGELTGVTIKEWKVEKLSSLADKIVDCPHSTPKWTDEGKLCVRTTAFKPFKLDLTDQKFVSEETYIKRVSRLKPEENDILYSREGAILGIACQIPKGVELCLGQRMIVIRAGENIDPKYLTIVLNSPVITDFVKSLTIGNAAPRINMSVIRDFNIPYPNMEIQKEIVRSVEKLFSLADRVETKYSHSKNQLDKLTQSTLAKAFRGELVTQDPNDESAELLLERIIAAKSNARTKSKK
ncbi:Type-1 restriction enzyme EcoKI specificity protein [BD1-7 clade bacterium]|uniref:Type-1 restriction enzyme EcoKI specificity protein n=1 Tax=BD1-7 clade bacterium TaxID=2029982 RepID=A0A5S9PA79_9GAMM|nr:Type-1 restriction enzyme EcoKI specificity protein [BD1-7 clade bacterium]CAA0101530.1 Type-1 restriction enzyme EcoKI specificity protein [BD1-7 clade bacterium]